ncbi:MAG: leucine--tRNA ligase, partial [Bacteroidales bacterium]|nr:leucine--tRNA ligase [Bacteroidales bacterium]
FSAEEWNSKTEKQQQEILMNYRLAYLSDTMVNWCSALGTVLANDEVKDGFSERGGFPVERKLMKQWSLRVTAYAQRLLDGLDKLDWFDSLKEVQRNWIGRSEGAMVEFPLHPSPALPIGEGEKNHPTPTLPNSEEVKSSIYTSVKKDTPPFYNTDSQMWALLKEKAKEARKKPTEAESIIWERLRNKQIGYKIRRQHVIDRFIVDFVCLEKMTIIEIDGKIHDTQIEEDRERTEILNKLGFSVIRFSNDEVITSIDEVIEKISTYLNEKVLPYGEDSGGVIEVFTTRPDTLFGATYMVLAPEHEFVEKITSSDKKKDVMEYVAWAKNRTERERLAEVKKITGVFTGAYAINPLNKKEIPIWVADYVLAGYGTSAIMSVPAHDSRDFAFAKHFDIPIIQVVCKDDETPTDTKNWEESYDAKEGKMINSGIINGMEVNDAIRATIKKIEEMGIGYGTINYKLRDAIFSRQRYWGEPFPVYYKNEMPYVLDESELPLKLPRVDKYLPTESGEPPLARAKNWKTSEGYPLETNTMPGFAGSSGYYLRYMDPKNDKEYFSKEANNYWKDIDLYIGGDEHGTGHLIYARFWNKFLFDIGLVCKDEPFKKLINQGKIQGVSQKAYIITNIDIKNKKSESYILPKDFRTKDLPKSSFRDKYIPIEYVNEKNQLTKENLKNLIKNYTEFNDYKIATYRDIKSIKSEFKKYFFNLNISKDDFNEGFVELLPVVEKMSKSKHNVQNPDDLIEKYGADTLRLYEMFLGPLEYHKPWDIKGIEGVFRFIRKLWRLYHDENNNFKVSDEEPTKDELKILHKTIKKVQGDIERFSFNTAVSAFMICVNELSNLKCNKRAILQELAILISPYAPHIAEELWHLLGNTESITYATFPEFREEYIKENTFTYPVSFNGKMRFKLDLPVDMPNKEIEKAVLLAEESQKWIAGKTPKKVIIVPKKIINIVI